VKFEFIMVAVPEETLMAPPCYIRISGPQQLFGVGAWYLPTLFEAALLKNVVLLMLSTPTSFSIAPPPPFPAEFLSKVELLI
jgi:hypothetical protein